MAKYNAFFLSLMNYVYNKLTKFYRSPMALRYPSVIKIEVTTHCNLRCPLCFKGAGMMTRPQGHMNMSVFKKVIDQAGGHCTEVTLTNFGENFLNNNIYEMISYAKAKHIKNVSTFSNFLTVSRQNIAEIVSSGLDEIVISLDGIDQGTYEKFRVGGNVNTVINNLKLLIEEKKKRGSKKPFVEVQCLLTKDTEGKIGKINSFLTDLGPDSVAFKALFLYIRDFNRLTKNDLDKAYRFLPKQEQLRVYKLDNNRINWRWPINVKSCIDPWRSITVTWDGKIIPCCFDWDAEYSMGDITKEHFSQIWNGAKYRKLRSDFLSGNLELCKNCPESVFDKFFMKPEKFIYKK